MRLKTPYLLFLGDAPDQPSAKTASGVFQWRPEWCTGQLRLDGCKADVGVPDISVADAATAGAKTLVIGVVNSGGFMPESWTAAIVEALEAGMDVASGLHEKLQSFPEIAAAAERTGGQLHNLREPASNAFSTDSGAPRAGKRVLAVGTDANVGKKYTALAMEKELRSRGLKADFRATGQTGVLISGSGTAVDAVIADFIAGAAAWLTPANDDDHWDCVEGQGAIFHPAFAGVTVGLLHGSQPDAVILCHDPEREFMRGTHHTVPGMREIMDAVLVMGRRTNPGIQFVGISVNTSSMSEDEAKTYLAGLEAEFALPACDPIRFGIGPIADVMLARCS